MKNHQIHVVVEFKNFFCKPTVSQFLGDGVCVFNSYYLTLSELTQFQCTENDKKSLSWTWILSQGEEPRTKDWQMLFEYLAATKWLQPHSWKFDRYHEIEKSIHSKEMSLMKSSCMVVICSIMDIQTRDCYLKV